MTKIWFNNNLSYIDYDFIARANDGKFDYTFVCRCNKSRLENAEKIDINTALKMNIWQICAVMEDKKNEMTYYLYPNGDKSYSFSPNMAKNFQYSLNFANK